MSDPAANQPIHLDADGRPRIIERRFVVDETGAGARLDRFLQSKIPRLSRTKLQEIIRTQVSRAGGRPVKPNSRVLMGEQILMKTPARPEPPCPRTFGVLFEDEHMMVVDKPAGLPMHASARYYFNTLTRILSETYPDLGLQICHRLDRETSGAVVVAKGKARAATLKDAFAAKTARKAYTAIVHGEPSWDSKTIDLPLGLVDSEDALIAIRMVTRPDALPSVTEVSVRERRGGYALVDCRPVTGRQHQIRAHLAEAGFPIVGDKLYTHGDEAFAEFCDSGMSPELLARFELPRQALHAASIAITHPVSGNELTVESPLPKELADFWATR